VADSGKENLALLFRAHHQIAALQASGSQEPVNRGLGRVGARALAFFDAFGALRRQPIDGQRQAARRGMRLRRRSSRARACIRAGISSEKSSIRRSGMGQSLYFSLS
jgi:hypothetical protein